MKRIIYLLIVGLGLCVQPVAQNLLNPSFDSVYFGGIDRVFDWITSDGIIFSTGTSGDTAMPLVPNTGYNAQGFQYHEILWFGNRIDTSPLSIAAMEISSRPRWKKIDGSFYESFVINGNSFRTDALGYPDLSRSGIPFTATPSALTGYYRFIDSTATGNNFGKCIILLKKWNAALGRSDTIAFTEYSAGLNPQSGIQPFTIPINYWSTDAPDTLLVAFIAATNPAAPASLWLDELGLVYGGIAIQESQIHPLAIYPNPVRDVLHVSGNDDPATMAIVNSNGQPIWQGTFSAQLSLKKLAPGAYFLLVTWLNGRQVKLPFVKID